MTTSSTRTLALLALTELLVMGLWFGVSAVAPQIAAEWKLSAGASAWLTLSVQLGFVGGTVSARHRTSRT